MFFKGNPHFNLFRRHDTLQKLRFPSGHYYHLYPSEQDLRTYHPGKIPGGIDLREEEQIMLMDKLKAYYDEFPYFRPNEKLLYKLDNGYFPPNDALLLYLMMRYCQPEKIIEAGTGYSTRLMIDINHLFFHDNINIHSVDPDTSRMDNIKKGCTITLKNTCVQGLHPDFFSSLKENDILFIDSSHVYKAGSDMQYIFSRILPELAKGVYIHFHDVFFPFEYPRAWLKSGRAFNEAYILASFLQFNNQFEIVIFGSYLEIKHKKWLNNNMPLLLDKKKNTISSPSGKQYNFMSGSQSIWLRKTV